MTHSHCVRGHAPAKVAGSNPTRSTFLLSLLSRFFRRRQAKIARAEFERAGRAPPLGVFSRGIEAEETREKYTRTLRRVLCGVFEESHCSRHA